MLKLYHHVNTHIGEELTAIDRLSTKWKSYLGDNKVGILLRYSSVHTSFRLLHSDSKETLGEIYREEQQY